jgi:hypothetical protein
MEPRDEYMHALEEASNFNESMYFNVYDPPSASEVSCASATAPTRATPS